MNTDALKYLIAISKERTMADAAEKLFLTPQALSMSIKKLEKELNMRLLYRFPNGVVLSENGEWLVELASNFFEDIDARIEQYADFAIQKDIEPKGKAVIAVNTVGVFSIKLASIIAAMTQKYPDFEVEVKELSRSQLEQMVLDDTVDFGFIFRTKLNGKFIDDFPKDLSFNPLQSGKTVMQVSPHLNIAKNDSVLLRKIAKKNICTYDPYDCDNNTKLLFAALNCDEIEYERMHSYVQYEVAVRSGRYLGMSIQLDDEITCVNYIDGMNVIYLQDDIEVYFGIVRKKGKPFSDNMKCVFNEVLKSYNLTMSDLTADI